MIETYSGSALLTLWIVFSAVAMAGIIAVLVWSARTGQFSNQEEARYLALRSGIPPSRPEALPPRRTTHVSP